MSTIAYNNYMDKSDKYLFSWSLEMKRKSPLDNLTQFLCSFLDPFLEKEGILYHSVI